MSVFGSLFTAVSGLQAQSDAISMISNNISNTSTVGYKAVDAAFSSLVTGTGSTTAYSSGSVLSIQNHRIDQQGILQQSNSPTDIALSGNGFFVVKAASSGGNLSTPLYTRAGSFTEDATGSLRNSAGFYLQGWPLDQNGNLPASQADISSLQPANVAFVGGLTLPTSTAALDMNLKADETQTPFGNVAAAFSPDFTRSITVYDSLGEGHNLSIDFKKMTSPTATGVGNRDLRYITGPIVGSLPATIPPFALGDTFSVKVGALAAVDIPAGGLTATTSMADILAEINAITDPASQQLVAFAAIDANGNLSIKARNPGQDVVLTDVAGAPLQVSQFGMGASPITYTAPGPLTVPPMPALLQPLNPVQTPNTEGWWTIDFRTPSGAVITSGAANFDGNGTLNMVKNLNRQVPISLTNIDWGNGAAQQNIAFDVAGISQFSGQYNVISSTQNGAALGLRTGVSIDKDGFVTAQFSNGQNSKIFKLAIATFSDPNGLQEQTGNVFQETSASGSYNLREAGQGSAGIIAPGSLEASNVDLADEFSKMIVTQRSYSANTKVISTTDQMMQELLQVQ
ncbi:MAG: flagellar hook protein FlgE [Proteobacteria bacterium]|nr:flagellar hook protein FlgE [Pseudomonadota bacterium]